LLKFISGSLLFVNFLPQTLELVLQVVTLFYGGHLVIKYEMTGGELVSLLLYQVSLSAAIDVSHK
jgi:ABC-type bacteriocin/lantibiotic exporter with double-glycine peptidase domain